MSRKTLHKVDHSILRYANCWEDAELLLQALQPDEDSEILSIGSAGDNSFSLLSRNPKRVVCVDLNQTQLALIRLKKAAFEALDYQDFLEFLGFVKGDALAHFEKVKKHLSEEDRRFWQQRGNLIEERLVYRGKFEKYLLVFQKKILPLMHSKKEVERLFETKSPLEQETFYEGEWNNLRWSIFTRLFFSRKVLGWGRDPEFLKQVKGNVGEQIKERINRHLSDLACQENLFLKFMLQGHFNGKLPHYARPENFEKIKANLHKLELHCAALEDFSGTHKFTHANLSNIFEYMDEEIFAANAKVLAGLMQSDAKIAYWNLLVKRDLAEDFPNEFASAELPQTKTDDGFFYRSFNLSTKL